jgi:hypothetical protein
MRLTIEIGQQERHHVEFLWSKWFGVAKIWVDGILKQKSRPLAFEELAQLASLRGVAGRRIRARLRRTAGYWLHDVNNDIGTLGAIRFKATGRARAVSPFLRTTSWWPLLGRTTSCTSGTWRPAN